MIADTTPNEVKRESGIFRPRCCYFHPNIKGTGSAVKFELHPAHDDVDGSIFMTIASQKSVGGGRDGVGSFSTFDWEHRICVKLDKTDLSHILQVFRGMQEDVLDGKGIFHRNASANTIIHFGHRIEPVPGYLLSVNRKALDATETQTASFFFNPTEALELSCAIEGAMIYVAFGIPMVIPRGEPRERRFTRDRHSPEEAEKAAAPVNINDPF